MKGYYDQQKIQGNFCDLCNGEFLLQMSAVLVAQTYADVSRSFE